MQEYVLWYQELGMHDVGRVGGKNASLGEMISNLANAGVQVPGGLLPPPKAFNEFLKQSGLKRVSRSLRLARRRRCGCIPKQVKTFVSGLSTRLSRQVRRRNQNCLYLHSG